MTPPPRDMDMTKDFAQEMVRFTKEYWLYEKACLPGGENYHGPYQKKHEISCWENPIYRKPYKESLPDDDRAEMYHMDRRYDRGDGKEL